MRSFVVITGTHLPQLIRLSCDLGPDSYDAMLLQNEAPVASLAASPVAAADALIVLLSGLENVAELRAMFGVHPASVFVVVAATHPPSAAIARVASQHGAILLTPDDSTVVIAAALVAALALRRGVNA